MNRQDIIDICNSLKISHVKFSQMSNIHLNTYKRFLSGENVTVNVLDKICSFIGYSMEFKHCPLPAIKCARCESVIMSRSRHDFVKCQCEEIFVDGGKDYFRYGSMSDNSVIDPVEPCELSVDQISSLRKNGIIITKNS